MSRRCDLFKIQFLIRGYLYFECDKTSVLSTVGLPNEVFKYARNEPNLAEVAEDFFREFFCPLYRPQCSLPNRSIRELRVVKDYPRIVYHRSSCNEMVNSRSQDKYQQFACIANWNHQNEKI